MSNDELRAELDRLKARLSQFERESGAEVPTTFEPKGYYFSYYATTGFLLGFLGACTSLMANVIGSVAWSQVTGETQHPLKLIQVYLTFPMGEEALKTDTGLLLALGCVLYIGTGMLYGMFFQVFLSRYFPQATLLKRLVLCSILALVIWVVNFYFLLSWLQPALFGGNWIVTMVPPWVAAVTHLVFGWTMAVVYPLGVFRTYRTDGK